MKKFEKLTVVLYNCAYRYNPLMYTTTVGIRTSIV